MNKKSTLLIVITVLFTVSQAQNLVSNPSFENIILCPTTVNQLSNAQGWINPSDASPDYHNACTNDLIVDVPKNGWGYQYAHTGNAYAGIGVVYKVAYPEGREYIQTELTQSLQAGKTYHVSFYISIAEFFGNAIDRIGIHVSNTAVSRTDKLRFNCCTPQIESTLGVLLGDTTSWTLISGNFVANGGEKFITIGNFANDASTTIFNLGGVNPNSYYYIDDVSVIEIADSNACSEAIFIPDVFSPNNDGQNDEWRAHADVRCINNYLLVLYTRWGEKIFETTEVQESWNGTFNGKAMNTGLFIYQLRANLKSGEEIDRKGNLLLIR